MLSLSFDEAEGPALDASSNGHVATIVGAARVAGVSGTALQFNGVDSLVTVPDADSLDLTAGMTIQAWVKPAAEAGGWFALVNKRGNGDEGLSYALYDGSSGPSGFVLVGGAELEVRSEVLLTPGVWTHMATTYDGETQHFFVNGVLVFSQPQGGSIDVSTGSLFIGSAGEGVFSGDIDEVRIYNRARSAAEIAGDFTPVP